MIEATDEMVRLAVTKFLAAPGSTIREIDEAMRETLTAVLALVERDYPATEYTVCVLPEDDPNRSVYAVKVANRGHGRWAVVLRSMCLNRAGEWDWEPSPSSRDDEWLTEHRFDRDEALRLAREAAPHVLVNGKTAAEALRDVRSLVERDQAGPCSVALPLMAVGGESPGDLWCQLRHGHLGDHENVPTRWKA